MRICDVCGKIMHEGYQVLGEYFCSDECLHTKYSQEEYDSLHCNATCELCENEKCYGDGDPDNAYWSTF